MGENELGQLNLCPDGGEDGRFYRTANGQCIGRWNFMVCVDGTEDSPERTKCCAV